MSGEGSRREAKAMKMLLDFLEMAGLALVSVSLWTLRVALTARGRKVAGSVTAGLEAIVFIVAFSRATADLGALERLAGYALGVAAGTFIGVYLDERLSTGQSEVRVVREGRDLALVRVLQAEGWPVTWVYGQGPRGDVTVAFVAVDDQLLASFLKTLKRTAPDSFWTVERLKSARAGRSDPTWHQVGQLTRFRPSRSRRPVRGAAGA
jgi:uncharacterized protein YebE (UPF0316 family)